MTSSGYVAPLAAAAGLCSRENFVQLRVQVVQPHLDVGQPLGQAGDVVAAGHVELVSHLVMRVFQHLRNGAEVVSQASSIVPVALA